MWLQIAESYHGILLPLWLWMVVSLLLLLINIYSFGRLLEKPPVFNGRRHFYFWIMIPWAIHFAICWYSVETFLIYKYEVSLWLTKLEMAHFWLVNISAFNGMIAVSTFSNLMNSFLIFSNARYLNEPRGQP
jgi:hypothetical protein